MTELKWINQEDLFSRFGEGSSTLFITGTAGSGKTELARTLAFLNDEAGNSTVVAERDREYGNLAEKLRWLEGYKSNGLPPHPNRFNVNYFPQDDEFDHMVLEVAADTVVKNLKDNKGRTLILDDSYKWGKDQTSDVSMMAIAKTTKETGTRLILVHKNLNEILNDKNPMLSKTFNDADIKVFFRTTHSQSELLSRKGYVDRADEEFLISGPSAIVVIGSERFKLGGPLPVIVADTRHNRSQSAA